MSHYTLEHGQIWVHRTNPKRKARVSRIWLSYRQKVVSYDIDDPTAYGTSSEWTVYSTMPVEEFVEMYKYLEEEAGVESVKQLREANDLMRSVQGILEGLVGSTGAHRPEEFVHLVMRVARHHAAAQLRVKGMETAADEIEEDLSSQEIADLLYAAQVAENLMKEGS